MTLQSVETALVTREASLLALQRAGISFSALNEGCVSVYELVQRIEPFEQKERQTILAEAITLTCARFLATTDRRYSGFETFLWLQLSESMDLESLALSFIDLTKVAVYAMGKYHDFLRGMFAASNKTRHQFYYEMLAKSGIDIKFGDIGFGESAAAFQRKASRSLDREHLLVFYSVELFLKAYMTLHPKDSPIADEKVEEFYRHFEAAIPLTGKFSKYSRDDSLFKFSASHMALPQIN